MKKVLYILPLVAFAFASCDNYFDEHHLDNGSSPVVDVRTDMTYVLTDDDYASVLTYNAEPADSLAKIAFNAIKTEKAFNDLASADIYLPAFFNNKFPYLDNGTMCEVTYRFHEGKTTRVAPFAEATGYQMVENDYRAIWNGRGASYLTPESEALIPAFLLTKLPTATEGKIVALKYNYFENEPDSIIPFLPYETTVSELLVAKEDNEHQLTGQVGLIRSTISGRFYLVDDNGVDSIYVYGLNDEDGNKVWKEKGIKLGDIITIKGKYTVVDGEPQFVDAVYVSHLDGALYPAPSRHNVAAAAKDTLVKTALYQLTEGAWVPYSNSDLHVAEALPQSVYDALGVTSVSAEQVLNYLRKTYLYPVADQIYLIAYRSSTGMTADEWTYDGSDFVQNTGYITEVMSFMVKNNAWEANISTYLASKFVGEGQGKWTIQNLSLDGLSYLWRYQASYGMTASSYVGGTNHRVTGYLISPNIKLKVNKNLEHQQPQLTFDQAVRYGNTTDNPKWLSVLVTDAFTGDVATTEWTRLPFPAELPDGSNWTFLPSGVFDLSAYIGKTINIAFCYNTDIEGVEVPSAPTWEIQNLLVAEPAAETPAE